MPNSEVYHSKQTDNRSITCAAGVRSALRGPNGRTTFPSLLATLFLIQMGAIALEPASARAGEGDIQEDPSPFTAAERSYWAFQPLRRPAVPELAGTSAARNPIDAFILDRLMREQLSLSKSADKAELLRRAKFNLHGLPPSEEEIERFVADTSSRAYEQLVDRLLASPRYGETWGRHWLDLVRFAETAGFNADPLRPLAYKYRNYVIRAFNSDTRYDQFVMEQVAGDELFSSNPEALIATGFNLLWPDESNASNVLLARQDALNDLTSSIGSVFLGMSIGCAQCHDHKFDPLLQTDFYRLQAFFAGIIPKEAVPVGSASELMAYDEQLSRWLAETAYARDELHNIESSARAKSAYIKRLKFPVVVLDAIDTPLEARSSLQQQLSFWSERQIVVTEKQLLAELTEKQQARRADLKQRIAKLEAEKPQPPGRLDAMVSVEAKSGPPQTHLLSGGSYDDPLEELRPGFLAILTSARANEPHIVPPRSDTSGRRSALAKWLADAANPLTVRVIVNRVWQGHFGQGLVANANDLGSRTAPPSHPLLLDWLSAEFIASGWSIKALHRLIMSSEVYRQSTYRRGVDQAEPRAASRDPGNQLYWHFPRQRLPAESVRDSMLAIADKLNYKMFGPGIRPELPPNFSARHGWDMTESEGERGRRSVYIHAKRNLPYPLLQVFDLPDMHESCARRSQTTVAPQALMVLNSGMIINFAKSFAERLRTEHPRADVPTTVRHAYLLAFCREPSEDETKMAVRFIARQRQMAAEAYRDADANGGAAELPKDMELPMVAALTDFCHALMNANEFIYID